MEKSLQTVLHGDDSRVQLCLAEIRSILTLGSDQEEKLVSILARYIGGDQIQMIQDRIVVLQTKVHDIASENILAQLATTIADIEKRIASLHVDPKGHIPDFMQEWQQEVDALLAKKAKIN